MTGGLRDRSSAFLEHRRNAAADFELPYRAEQFQRRHILRCGRIALTLTTLLHRGLTKALHNRDCATLGRCFAGGGGDA